MSTHIMHPRIVDHGLVDGCDRCAELAADPFAGLDDGNLLALRRRTERWMDDCEFPRSETEAVAMLCMEQALVRLRRLERIESEWEDPDKTDVQIYGAGSA